MNQYVYPAVFHANDDGSYTITFPDLPGCISEGNDLADAIYMAEDALTQWAAYMESQGEIMPAASAVCAVQCEEGAFVNLVRAVVRDERIVRHTVTLPKWLDEQAARADLSLSRVLRDALKERLGKQYTDV